MLVSLLPSAESTSICSLSLCLSKLSGPRSGAWYQIRRSSARTRRVLCSNERIWWDRDCARDDGGAPGRKPGAQPVLRERFGTRRLWSWICDSSSSSSSLCPSWSFVFWLGLCIGSPSFLRLLPVPVPLDVDAWETLQEAISSVCKSSARTPHTAAVSPTRTTALPLVCVRDPVFADVTRN